MEVKPMITETKKVKIPPKIKKLTLLGVLAYMCNFMGFTFLIPISAIIAKELIASKGAAGLPLTVLSIAAILSAIPFGKFAAKGRKIPLIVIACLFIAGDILSFSGYMIKSGNLYLLGNVVLGFGVGGMANFVTVISDLYPPKYKGTASGYANIGYLGAIGFGYLLIGPVIDKFGFSSAFYAAIAIEILCIILVLAIHPDTLTISKNLEQYWPAEALKTDTPTDTPTEISKSKKPERNILVMLLIYPIFMQLFLRVSVHVGSNFVNVALPIAFQSKGFVVAAISGFMAVRGVSAALSAYPIGKLLDKIGRKIGFIAAPICTAVGILGVAFMPNTILVGISLVLIGIGFGFSNVVGPTIISDISTSDEKAKTMSIFSIATNIGGFIFPIPIALIMSGYGFQGLAIACALYFCIPLLMGLFVKEKGIGKYLNKGCQ